MSATIMVRDVPIAVAYSREAIYSAIMDGRTGRGFTLVVDGQELDLVRDAMRCYCDPPSKAAEIMAAITPEGYEYDHHDAYTTSYASDMVCRAVRFRRIAPTVEYEYVTDGKERKPKPGDWIPMHGGFSEVRAGDINFETQLCYRRVEVKR